MTDTLKRLVDRCDDITQDQYAFEKVLDYNGLAINYAAMSAIDIMYKSNPLNAHESLANQQLKTLLDNLALLNGVKTKSKTK